MTPVSAQINRGTRALLIVSVILLTLTVILLIANATAVFSAPLASTTVPNEVGFEGFLADVSGNPVADGTYSMTVAIYSVASGGTAVWSDTFAATPVTKGLYSIVLGSQAALTANAFDGSRWIGVRVDGVNGGNEISPRTRVSAVPFALNAPWTGLSGVPAGFADGIDNNSGGTITGVTAGAGLSGGGSSGNVTVSADTAYLQRRVGSCSVGSTIRAIAADGTATCSSTIWARAYNSTSVSITNATWSQMPFNSERWDTDNIHNTSSNTWRLTASTAGIYLVTFNGAFAANTTGSRGAVIYINSTTSCNGTPVAAILYPAATIGNGNISLSTAYSFAVGDYAEVCVYQNSGGPLNMSYIGNYSPEFSMVRVP